VAVILILLGYNKVDNVLIVDSYIISEEEHIIQVFTISNAKIMFHLRLLQVHLQKLHQVHKLLHLVLKVLEQEQELELARELDKEMEGMEDLLLVVVEIIQM
jgi:hypothetical protein